jgi:hypothetical protein
MFKELFTNQSFNEAFENIKKGAFTKWCKENGYMDKDSDDVPCKCVKAGLKSKDKHVVKMAAFAKGIGGNC